MGGHGGVGGWRVVLKSVYCSLCDDSKANWAVMKEVKDSTVNFLALLD